MLLNSWATLEAIAPTLLRRWACSNCCRSCSASEEGTITSWGVMNHLLGSRHGTASGGRCGRLETRQLFEKVGGQLRGGARVLSCAEEPHSVSQILHRRR